MQVELKQDLVGSCVVGDVVTVLGLVKVLATGDAKPTGKLQQRCLMTCSCWQGQLLQDGLDTCRPLHSLGSTDQPYTSPASTGVPV